MLSSYCLQGAHFHHYLHQRHPDQLWRPLENGDGWGLYCYIKGFSKLGLKFQKVTMSTILGTEGCSPLIFFTLSVVFVSSWGKILLPPSELQQPGDPGQLSSFKGKLSQLLATVKPSSLSCFSFARVCPHRPESFLTSCLWKWVKCPLSRAGCPPIQSLSFIAPNKWKTLTLACC